MTQNISISGQIKAFLDNDFIIRKCLFKNIISLRALSRHIIKKLGLEEKTLDAVLSAVRRYKKSEKKEPDERLKRLFSKISIKTRSNVADIRVQKSKRSVESISRLNSIVDIEKGEIIRIIQSEQSITIIIDEKNLEKFYSIFSKADCISIDKRLVEINLQFTEEAQNVRGIAALVASSLNAEDINLVEIMSCAPELIVIVKKEDLLKALNVVDKLQELA